MKKILFLLLLTTNIYGQHLQVELIEPLVNSSFRGLSVVNNEIAWVSGSNGWVGVSLNGGTNWDFHQVKNFEQVDFRSLYAFSATKALIANAGSPASILITDDGGLNWKEVYRNESKEAFLDGVDFWNNSEGIIYGDPDQGKLAMLRTSDGGVTWKEFELSERPEVVAGEASFAASGTGIRCYDENKIVLATGGLASHLLFSNDKGKHWKKIDAPIIQGKSSTGIFSAAFYNQNNGIIVGGDYLIDSLKTNHVFYTHDAGIHWVAPVKPTRGYRECVEFRSENIVVSVGPSGSDISIDGGLNWKILSDEKGFHVIRKARKGSLMILAGSKGKIGLIK